MTKDLEPKWISGFWRRVGALLIDTLILGIVGSILGVVLEDTFVELGGWGRLIGFCIALVYFGIMNSAITGGQTIGKRALKLRVVDATNSPIGLGKSVLRYFVLGTPFFLNGAHFSQELIFSYLIYPLSVIVFGGLFSILYLYIFNRNTRQSLHDLVVGSFVVNADADQESVGTVWKPHLVVVTVLFLASAIGPFFATQFAEGETFEGMLAAQKAVSSEPGVTYATVSTNTTTVSTVEAGASTSSAVYSQVFRSSETVDDVAFARRVAAIVVENYPQALEFDTIQVTLTYGYDIGIASRWFNYPHTFETAEFQNP